MPFFLNEYCGDEAISGTGSEYATTLKIVLENFNAMVRVSTNHHPNKHDSKNQ